MINNGSFSWPPAAAERLKAMRGSGHSSAQIARAISSEFDSTISRKSVMSKAHRMGLSGSVDEAVAEQRANAARRSSVNNKPAKPSSTIPIASIEEAYGDARVTVLTDRQRAVDAIAANPLVISDVNFGGCRFPLYRTAGDGQILLCCNPRPSGAAYCTGHHRLAFAKTIPADQRAEERAKTSANMAAGGNPSSLNFGARVA